MFISVYLAGINLSGATEFLPIVSVEGLGSARDTAGVFSVSRHTLFEIDTSASHAVGSASVNLAAVPEWTTGIKHEFGGLDAQITAITAMITRFYSYDSPNPTNDTPDVYRPPCSCLLHGPHGTGKTSLARRVAQLSGIPSMVLNNDNYDDDHGPTQRFLRLEAICLRASSRRSLMACW